MENSENWEQPNQSDDVQVTEVKSEEGISSSNDNGSQLGKFKDTESLLSAYNNLQAEFTKKCQKLSELEKKSQEIAPVYESEDWTDKVSSFLEKNEDAKDYATEISSYIMSNPEIMKKDDALEIAWSKVVQQKYVAPQKLANDEDYIEKYIMSNETIKQKILNEYIKEIQNSSPPPVISKDVGGSVAFSSKKQPQSLSEAKKAVEEIFNLKGE